MSSEPRLFIDPSLPKHNINCWGDHPTDCKQFLHLGASKCVIVWYQQSKSRMWWRFSCVKGHWAWMIVCEKRFCAIHPNFLNYCQALKNGRKHISHGKQKCFSQRIFKMEWKVRNCDCFSGYWKVAYDITNFVNSAKTTKIFSRCSTPTHGKLEKNVLLSNSNLEEMFEGDPDFAQSQHKPAVRLICWS